MGVGNEIAHEVVTTLNLRKGCNDSCIYFRVCPLVERSLSTEGCPCLMRSEPAPKILRFARLVCSGVDGIREEISQTLYNFHGDEKEYIDALLKYYKIAVVAESKTKTTKGTEVIDVVMTHTEGRMLSPTIEGMDEIEVPEDMIESRDDPESLFAQKKE